MPVAITVDINEEQLAQAVRMLQAIGARSKAVVAKAINRTLVTLRKEIAQELRRTLNVKARALKHKRHGIRISRATSKSLRGMVRLSGERIPLIEFGARDLKRSRRGVSYQISRTEARKTIKTAFIATMPSGHRGIFVRAFTSELEQVKRLPIWERRGPSIGHVFNEDLRKRYTFRAAGIFAHHLEGLLEYELKKHARRVSGAA